MHSISNMHQEKTETNLTFRVNRAHSYYWLHVHEQEHTDLEYVNILIMHSKKKCWVVSTQIWMKNGQTQNLAIKSMLKQGGVF